MKKIDKKEYQEFAYFNLMYNVTMGIDNFLSENYIFTAKLHKKLLYNILYHFFHAHQWYIYDLKVLSGDPTVTPYWSASTLSLGMYKKFKKKHKKPKYCALFSHDEILDIMDSIYPYNLSWFDNMYERIRYTFKETYYRTKYYIKSKLRETFARHGITNDHKSYSVDEMKRIIGCGKLYRLLESRGGCCNPVIKDDGTKEAKELQRLIDEAQKSINTIKYFFYYNK